jgi:hypothetical protein
MLELKTVVVLEYMESFNTYLKDVISDSRYHYSIASGYAIKAKSLANSDVVRFRDSQILEFTVGNLLYFHHDLDHECSFIIDEKPLKTIKSIFNNIDNYHAKKAFLSIMKHLKNINEGNAINKKRKPFYSDIPFFEIFPVYVFDASEQRVYQKVILKFKRHNLMDELYVVVKNNDKSFNDAMKIIDNEFYKRYYSKIITKNDTTEKLTKSEKQIVKMYYY